MYVHALGKHDSVVPHSTLHTNFNITASVYFLGGLSMETSAALSHTSHGKLIDTGPEKNARMHERTRFGEK